MDQARVNPLLLDDELNLVVQARLVRRGEGEEGHADVDLRYRFLRWGEVERGYMERGGRGGYKEK